MRGGFGDGGEAVSLFSGRGDWKLSRIYILYMFKCEEPGAESQNNARLFLFEKQGVKEVPTV